MMRALIVAVLQVALVAGLGAKLLVDRARYPRVWVETAPVDPDLPIRGRYVRLQLRAPYDDATVAFFIPEHVDDPSLRPAGETLWVEVTAVPDGAPRPIRLGVRQDNGDIVPL